MTVDSCPTEVTLSINIDPLVSCENDFHPSTLIILT